MANLDLLMRSLEFIEDHLEDTVAVQTEDIAAACYASKSALEKVFKYTIRFSVHDYIIRRKMTRAARMMIEKPALSILDIAVQFGYSSHEAFMLFVIKLLVSVLTANVSYPPTTIL